MVMEMQLNGLGTLAPTLAGRDTVVARTENAVNYRSSMQDLARIRAQRVIFSATRIDDRVTIVSVWDLVQENRSSCFNHLSQCLTVLAH